MYGGLLLSDGRGGSKGDAGQQRHAVADTALHAAAMVGLGGDQRDRVAVVCMPERLSGGRSVLEEKMKSQKKTDFRDESRSFWWR